MNKEKWHNYGESSLTLLAVHVGMDKRNPATPLDQWDFKRCIHLFDCLGLSGEECSELIEKTASKYKNWEPIKENWNKLINLYFNTEFLSVTHLLQEISSPNLKTKTHSTPPKIVNKGSEVGRGVPAEASQNLNNTQEEDGN